MITPHLHPPQCPAYTPARCDRVSNVFLPPSHPRGDHAPRYQVMCDSPSNPTHHARLLVSALPPRCVPRSIAILPSQVLAPLPARTKWVLRGTVAPAPSCTGHSALYRLLRRVERVTDCARATAMVVKRNTRNEGNTHRNPTVPRVQPLLKCGPSFAPNP